MSWYFKNKFLLFLPDGGEKPLQFILNFLLLILSKTKKIQKLLMSETCYLSFDNT